MYILTAEIYRRYGVLLPKLFLVNITYKKITLLLRLGFSFTIKCYFEDVILN